MVEGKRHAQQQCGYQPIHEDAKVGPRRTRQNCAEPLQEDCFDEWDVLRATKANGGEHKGE